MQFQKGLLHHKCTYTYRVADTLRERRHVYGVRANTTANKVKIGPRFSLKGKSRLTSVIMTPVIGPRKTVYPLMKDKKPVALRSRK